MPGILVLLECDTKIQVLVSQPTPPRLTQNSGSPILLNSEVIDDFEIWYIGDSHGAGTELLHIAGKHFVVPTSVC